MGEKKIIYSLFLTKFGGKEVALIVSCQLKVSLCVRALNAFREAK
jgi:hypothetical protein